MTSPTETAIALLRDAENYLSALHGSVARHDNLAANLGCAGCELRGVLAAALPELTAAAVPAGPAPATDRTGLQVRVLREIIGRISGTGTDDAATEEVGAATVLAVLRGLLADLERPAPADRAAVIAEVLPAWEAVYEPGNVSNYLIGYANDQDAATGMAEAWMRSQAEVTGRMEWVDDEQLATGNYDRWFELIERHGDGVDTGTSIVVRRRLADEGPLSPYYEHPECGFHWHGRDGMDIPMQDGQPVCPRCELGKAEKLLTHRERRCDELRAESKRRGKVKLEYAERIRQLENELDEVRTQLGAEILRAGQAEAELRRLDGCSAEPAAGAQQPKETGP
ncbi:hypothetical protein [Streptomyces sp. NPDC007110]|uniref:hypothetical protein n=1 Tax=Streptomyces sp. NPDC007110 TaxID=3156916 RepID=UPI0033E18DAF